MNDFNPLIFIANHAGMNLADAIKEAYEQGKRDAQPQPKTGKWVKNYSVIRCSECKRSSWSLSFEDLVRNFNYCPNCGAKMKEGDLND